MRDDEKRELGSSVKNGLVFVFIVILILAIIVMFGLAIYIQILKKSDQGNVSQEATVSVVKQSKEQEVTEMATRDTIESADEVKIDANKEYAINKKVVQWMSGSVTYNGITFSVNQPADSKCIIVRYENKDSHYFVGWVGGAPVLAITSSGSQMTTATKASHIDLQVGMTGYFTVAFDDAKEDIITLEIQEIAPAKNASLPNRNPNLLFSIAMDIEYSEKEIEIIDGHMFVDFLNAVLNDDKEFASSHAVISESRYLDIQNGVNGIDYVEYADEEIVAVMDDTILLAVYIHQYNKDGSTREDAVVFGVRDNKIVYDIEDAELSVINDITNHYYNTSEKYKAWQQL